MDISEFKNRIYEIIVFQSESEKKRFELISNKQLRNAGIYRKDICTDKDVRQAWIKFNKHQADWERYCRASKQEVRFGKKYFYGDYSHLAYNGVSDDF